MAAVTAAVVGIAATGASTYMSFSNAAKAKREGEAAAAAASKSMVEAKKKAQVDFYEGLTVPLDAYEAEFENNLAVAQQTTEALQEGDPRALAAGVGRVGAASSAQAEQTRIGMGKELSDLQAIKAQSKDAMNQQLIEMDVANARQQNQIAAQANQARSQAIQQGIQGIGAMATGIGEAAPLYGKKKAPTPPTGAGGANMKMAIPEGTSASGAPLTVPVMTPTGSMFDIPGAGDYSGGFNAFTPPVNPFR
jgi:hypothetical protein